MAQRLAFHITRERGSIKHLGTFCNISRASYDLPFDTLCATVRSKFLERASYYTCSSLMAWQ